MLQINREKGFYIPFLFFSFFFFFFFVLVKNRDSIPINLNRSSSINFVFNSILFVFNLKQLRTHTICLPTLHCLVSGKRSKLSSFFTIDRDDTITKIIPRLILFAFVQRLQASTQNIHRRRLSQ